jgi:hypothetical protein
MKSVRDQLVFDLQGSQQCRSVRRSKKPNPARTWFEKMRQVVDGAAEQPVSGVPKSADLPRR